MADKGGGAPYDRFFDRTTLAIEVSGHEQFQGCL
jgi:hypothetical protein